MKRIIIALAVLALLCSCSLFEPEEPSVEGTWRHTEYHDSGASSWTMVETLVITERSVKAKTTYENVIWWDSSAKRYRQTDLEKEREAEVHETDTDIMILDGMIVSLDSTGEPVSGVQYRVDKDFLYLFGPLSATRYTRVK